MLSTVTPVVTEPGAAARAGADLRAARERLGLTLHDVSCDLRIRLAHLEALEEGHISLLPGNAYALAFVRTYARALGLDAEEMVRRFRAEAAEVSRRTELVFPIPMPERGLPAGAVLLLGLVLAIGAYTGWYRLSGDGRLPAETVTAIPERLAPLAEQAVPPAPNLSVATDAADTAAPKIVLSDSAAPAMLPNPAPPVMSISPISAAAAPMPSREPDASLVVALPPESVGAVSPAPVADESRIVLRATADAWVQVKDRTGSLLLNRILKAGDTWPVPARQDLLLTTGNAGGTDVLVDGAPTPSLGAPGAVRRDMLLDPEQIKQGRLAGAAAPQVAPIRARQ